MEKAATALLLLLLLAAPRVAWGSGSACCDWWGESVEWPVGASHCPAALPDGGQGGNATYCCGLCYAAHHRRAFEEEDAACPAADELPVTSGTPTSKDFFVAGLCLIFGSVILFCLSCLWRLWVREGYECSCDGPACAECGSSVADCASSVGSQLRASLTSCCSSFSRPDSLELTETTQDVPHQGTENPAPFFQQTVEDDILSPVVHKQAQEQKEASGGTPVEKRTSGVLPEKGAIEGPWEEGASGGSLEKGASGGHPESKLN